MRVTDLLEQWFLKRADQWVDRRPRRPATPPRLAKARVVAHRGVYDNERVFENTMAAFAQFQAAGGWGIELDVRWTSDGVPVIAHDPDGQRLFGVDRSIAAMDLNTLQRHLPLVPTLADVVARFGGRMHLMVEIKSLPPHAFPRPNVILQRHFEHLAPARDYHLLSLDPALLKRLDYSPGQACIPIARANSRKILGIARSSGWGGIAGHYALIRHRQVDTAHRQGLRVGTGFVNSPNCLHRELARGVDWLFSDRPLELQDLLSPPPARDT